MCCPGVGHTGRHSKSGYNHNVQCFVLRPESLKVFTSNDFFVAMTTEAINNNL